MKKERKRERETKEKGESERGRKREREKEREERERERERERLTSLTGRDSSSGGSGVGRRMFPIYVTIDGLVGGDWVVPGVGEGARLATCVVEKTGTREERQT